MEEKTINKFISKVERKFQKYFVAYSLSSKGNLLLVNIIIDDRDILKMDKKDLINKIDAMLNQFIKETSTKIKAKTVLVSDLSSSTIWEILGQKAVILNVKALTSFVNIKLPADFLESYKKLPIKFKLSDFKREISTISKEEFHRNTYQNWLKSLEVAGFIRLKDKTYFKIEEPYKQVLIGNLNK